MRDRNTDAMDRVRLVQGGSEQWQKWKTTRPMGTSACQMEERQSEEEVISKDSKAAACKLEQMSAISADWQKHSTASDDGRIN